MPFPRLRAHLNVTSALFAAAMLTSCMTVQPLEPKLSPPSHFQTDNKVMVEFVHPAKIGFRCAERGAKFLGLPGINSGACADETLVTMPNPCFTITSGWYAEILCHELGHVNGWAANHAGGSFKRQAPIRSASSSPQALALAAAARTGQSASPAPSSPVEAADLSFVSLDSQAMPVDAPETPALSEAALFPALEDRLDFDIEIASAAFDAIADAAPRLDQLQTFQAERAPLLSIALLSR